MFSREVNLGNSRLIISFSNHPVLINGDNCLFGFPLETSIEGLDASSISDELSRIRGYFLYIGFHPGRVVVANDTAGGYRLYLYQSGKTTYVSDQLETIIESMHRDGAVELHDHEYRYWQKHGYTTGGATFFKKLSKLSPATVMEFTSDGISENCYFPDMANQPDSREHKRRCLEDLNQTVETLSETGKDIVLFFSGGIDSTLLALLLKESNCRLRLVFTRSKPYYRDNYESHIRARAVSEYLGLALEEIDVELDHAIDNMADIAQSMLFDRHPAVLHFAAMKEVARRYGTDIVVVNGQGADSVLSFGPSGMTRGDYAARVLLYRPFGTLARIAGEMVRRNFGKHLHQPASDTEYLIAFFDQNQYYTMLSNAESGDYRSYLTSIVDRISPRFKNRDALMMYSKIYTFIQGSDNQVVLQSARAAGIDKIVMPYVSPGFVLNTVRHKDSKHDLMRPKYVVRDGLKDLGFDLPKSKVNFADHQLIPLETISERVMDAYLSEIDRVVGPPGESSIINSRGDKHAKQ